ncbi:MAG: hypothetical protein ACHQT8_00375 [Chlamydiales bacterium]
MNILMLIGSFLVIISLGMMCMTKEVTASAEKQRYFKSFLDLERQAQNGLQSHAYRTVKKKKTAEQQKRESSRKRASPAFARDRKDPLEDSKLDLSLLLLQPRPAFFDTLYEVAAAHLRAIYGKSGLAKTAKNKLGEGFEYLLLDAMIQKGREEKQPFTFEQLIPEQGPLKEVFLKMVRGTSRYELNAPRGYPPLEDFFILGSTNKRAPIAFIFASTPLLKALFGDVVAMLIADAETEKGRALEEKELEVLLLQHSTQTLRPIDLKGMVSFFTKPSTPQAVFTITDKKSKISRKVRKVDGKGGAKP